MVTLCLKFLDAFFKGILPPADVEVERLLYFRLVQHGVVRTLCRHGVVLCVDGLHVAVVDAFEAVYGPGEIVPRANALVGEVVNARRDALADYLHDGAGEVAAWVRGSEPGGDGRCPGRWRTRAGLTQSTGSRVVTVRVAGRRGRGPRRT